MSQKLLTDLKKQIDQKKSELSEIQKEAERLKQTDPKIMDVQLAEVRQGKCSRIGNNYWYMRLMHLFWRFDKTLTRTSSYIQRLGMFRKK